MKRGLEYGLFALVPAITIGLIGFAAGLNKGGYCSCGICTFTVQEVGFYIGMMCFSGGLILGAISYVVWDKKMKRKNLLKLVKKQ